MIDTAEKRRAVAGIAAFPLGPSVTPNVAKDAEWRQQAAWGYSGIAADEPGEVGPGDVSEWIIRYRRRGRR